MSRLAFTVGALLVVAHGAAAQSASIINKPKQAAANAVAATNAQTRAGSTLDDDTTQVQGAPRRAAATDSAAGTTAVSGESAAATPSGGAPAAAPRTSASFQRETFTYDRSGRRDPFVSLMTTSDLRPLLTDLKLVAVAYDPQGRNSVAVLRDIGTKDQYRIRVGQSLGRMRVAGISPRAVVFTIEEFGYSRQETLALGDSNTEKKQ